MDYVKTFRDLQVYMLARLLAREKFEATKDFSFVERFSLADRMRRSSRSVGAQIAEAHLRGIASAGRPGQK